MKIFEQYQIRNYKLKNRIVMPAMLLNYTPEGMVTDQLISFYKLRAQGGAGLIIVGGCVINDLAGGKSFISLKNDQVIEGLTKLTKEIKKFECVTLAQLYHGGRYVHSFLINNNSSVSSSPVKSKFTGETPRQLSVQEIQSIEEDFVLASQRAVKAGFNGVEIMGSAGYLISQFLSPAVNERTDEYGGSLENRFRFLSEVYTKIRNKIGSDHLIGVRLSGNEFVSKGNKTEETVKIGIWLERLGIDYINITGGWHETNVPQILSQVPAGGLGYLAKLVKQNVKIPVIASNRINDPFIGENILRSNMADLIAMGRALIADPEIIQKFQNKKHFTHCIACNQGCFDSIMRLEPVGCTVRPQVGNEHEDTVRKIDKLKKVVVIGGGPAGLKCSLTLKQRGHNVILIEKEEKLGGNLLYVPMIPGKKEYRHAADDLEKLIEEQGVEIIRGKLATPEFVYNLHPDAVVISSGKIYSPPPIKGIDKPHVISALNVFAGHNFKGKNIAIIGGGGVGIDTALYLSRFGTLNPEQLYFLLIHEAEKIDLLKELILKGSFHITIFEKLRRIGRDVGPSTRWALLKDLNLFGVEVKEETKVVEIYDSEIKIVNIKTKIEQTVPCDTVIYATGSKPDNSFYTVLKEKIKEVYIIGDANSGNNLNQAIKQAYEIGNTI